MWLNEHILKGDFSAFNAEKFVSDGTASLIPEKYKAPGQFVVPGSVSSSEGDSLMGTDNFVFFSMETVETDNNKSFRHYKLVIYDRGIVQFCEFSVWGVTNKK